MTQQDRSLEGVKVLDLSRLLPAPFATMVLADLGARVDKLEDPKGGDFARVTPPHAPDGMGVMYHWINRGKRSLVLDLKQPSGREALLRLIPEYDVLVESNRPGVMERLGLGYEALREHNPGLVYCALTGYGQDGPLRDRAGHDLNYIARAGVLGMSGPEGTAPQVPGVQMADITGGLFAVVGILSALAARARTGEGRFVDISMAEGAISLGTFGFASHFGGFPVPGGSGALMGSIAPYGTYRTKDGGAVSLGALEPKFWASFCEGTGLPNEPAAQYPGPHQAEWKARVTEIIAQRTTAEWATFGATHDCCLEPVLTPDEAVEDPQHTARQVWVERPVDGGTVRMARTPVAPAAEGVAPRQGEHSSAVLAEGGFTPEEVEALRRDGVTR